MSLVASNVTPFIAGSRNAKRRAAKRHVWTIQQATETELKRLADEKKAETDRIREDYETEIKRLRQLSTKILSRQLVVKLAEYKVSTPELDIARVRYGPEHCIVCRTKMNTDEYRTCEVHRDACALIEAMEVKFHTASWIGTYYGQEILNEFTRRATGIPEGTLKLLVADQKMVNVVIYPYFTAGSCFKLNCVSKSDGKLDVGTGLLGLIVQVYHVDNTGAEIITNACYETLRAHNPTLPDRGTFMAFLTKASYECRPHLYGF